jgi:hypothetical protein
VGTLRGVRFAQLRGSAGGSVIALVRVEPDPGASVDAGGALRRCVGSGSRSFGAVPADRSLPWSGSNLTPGLPGFGRRWQCAAALRGVRFVQLRGSAGVSGIVLIRVEPDPGASVDAGGALRRCVGSGSCSFGAVRACRAWPRSRSNLTPGLPGFGRRWRRAAALRGVRFAQLRGSAGAPVIALVRVEPDPGASVDAGGALRRCVGSGSRSFGAVPARLSLPWSGSNLTPGLRSTLAALCGVAWGQVRAASGQCRRACHCPGQGRT